MDFYLIVYKGCPEEYCPSKIQLTTLAPLFRAIECFKKRDQGLLYQRFEEKLGGSS